MPTIHTPRATASGNTYHRPLFHTSHQSSHPHTHSIPDSHSQLLTALYIHTYMYTYTVPSCASYTYTYTYTYTHMLHIHGTRRRGGNVDDYVPQLFKMHRNRVTSSPRPRARRRGGRGEVSVPGRRRTWPRVPDCHAWRSAVAMYGLMYGLMYGRCFGSIIALHVALHVALRCRSRVDAAEEP